MTSSPSIQQNSAHPPRGERPRSQGAPWFGFYGMLLVVLIVVYYIAILAALFELIRICWANAQVVLPFSSASILPLVLVTVTLLLAFQLGWRLVRDLPGLVTPIYDEVPEATEGISIRPEEFGELFDFVSSVAQEVGAPMPDDIRITYMAQCFVAEQREFGFRPQRELILVLGLPQLLIFNTAELKVILAHELAHFRSGDTTQVVFIFRFVETLRRGKEELGRTWWWFMNPVYWMVAGYFRIFLGLSGPLLRLQELQADWLSASLYGGEIAGHTLLKDWLLVGQFDTAVATFGSRAKHKEGDQNVFRWFVERWHDFSDAGQDYLLKRLSEEERTSFFDPRPTMQARIDAMRKLPDREHPQSQPVQNLLSDTSDLEDQLVKMMYE